MSRRALTRLLVAPAALGAAGAALAALAAPRALADPVVGWWYHPHLLGSRPAAVVLVWVGMGLLGVAWVGVLALVRAGAAWTRAQATVLAVAWILPLALGPPLFSRDAYSYLAQGTILHLGLNPYHAAPDVLAGLHRGHVLAAVSPFWRHTTAPYGPLFLALLALVVSVVGQHLIAGVLLCRVLDLAGLALLAVHLPRLARALGADVGAALWLGLFSPLVLLGLVAPAHNDLLMAGLLVGGASVALRGRPLLGIAVCALAATIKVPALVGAAFIAVAWARTEPPGARARLLAAAVLLILGVLAVVTLTTGVGLAWVSSGIFSTPGRVRLAITPATGIGYTVAWLLHAAGVAVSGRRLESVLAALTSAAAALLGLRLLVRVRVPTLPAALGTTLVLAAVGGPAAWPWYLLWGCALLAAVPEGQRSPALAGALVLGGFLVKPNGVLAIPLGAAPAVVVAELALLAGWVLLRRRRRQAQGRAAPGPLADGAGPALLRT